MLIGRYSYKALSIDIFKGKRRKFLYRRYYWACVFAWLLILYLWAQF